jgi:hypothetical protein
MTAAKSDAISTAPDQRPIADARASRDDAWMDQDERAVWQRKREESIAAYERDVAPLKQALRSEGIDITDLGRFVNRPFPGVIEPSRFDCDGAVPVFLDWLPRIANVGVKETIVRSLKTKGAKRVATEPLIAEFVQADEDSLKWTIGDTLSYVADKSQYELLVPLAADTGHGYGRGMLVEMLWRVKTPRADEVLLASIQQHGVSFPAMSALRRRLGNAEARVHIAALVDHPDEAIRVPAREQIKRIDKVLSPR